jgi:type I restriction enzyme M protein
MPDVQSKYLQWSNGKGEFTDRTQKAFEISLDDIRAQSYDLSINRYRQLTHTAEKHVDPRKLLEHLKALEKEIQNELVELEGLLG